MTYAICGNWYVNSANRKMVCRRKKGHEPPCSFNRLRIVGEGRHGRTTLLKAIDKFAAKHGVDKTIATLQDWINEERNR